MDSVAHQGEGIAPAGITVQAIDTVSICNFFVLRTGAWHATCPWEGDRRLVVLYGRGNWQSLPPSHHAFLRRHAFRLLAG